MSNYQQWCVVLVEDEFDSAEVVVEILHYYGIEVHIAHNGVECMELLAQIKPNLVITDLAMPQMDGWETLAYIRSNPTTAHIPVVAVTAYHSSVVALNAQEAGFDAYFPKPVNPVSFVQQLEKLMG